MMPGGDERIPPGKAPTAPPSAPQEMDNCRQYGARAFSRWTGAFCLLLVLLFTGLEASHIHSTDAISGTSSTPCLICISAHSTAPAVAVHSLTPLWKVGFMATEPEVMGQGISSRLEIFIRPPPAA